MLSRSDGVTALPASATVSVDGSRALGVTGDGGNQPAAQVRQTSFNLEPNQVKTRANTAQGSTEPSGVGVLVLLTGTPPRPPPLLLLCCCCFYYYYYFLISQVTLRAAEFPRKNGNFKLQLASRSQKGGANEWKRSLGGFRISRLRLKLSFRLGHSSFVGVIFFSYDSRRSSEKKRTRGKKKKVSTRRTNTTLRFFFS